MAQRRRDLYELLGVPRDADAEAIRKAYRRLARRFHPDVNPGDEKAEERFKEVSEAYAVLCDPEKRRDYDEFGEVSLESGFDREAARRAREAFGQRFGGAGPGGFDFEPGGQAYSFGDIDDLLSGFFGGGGSGRRGGGGVFRRPGADVETELELDFLEAARGTEKRLTLPRPTAEGGTRTETVTVRIPPGVDSGGRIRISGKGGEGHGGAPAGDLYARIRVRPHPVFRREGRDLYVNVPVTVSEAALGARVEVPTLEGRATVTVPPGTDSGARLRLRGKGIPGVGSLPAGDLYAVIQIRVPRNLDEEGREAVERLKPYEPAEPRKGLVS